MNSMNNNKSRGFNITYIFPIVILSYTFSMLWGWIPYTRSLIPLIIGLAAGCYISKGFFSTRSFVCLLIYAVVLFINMMAGDHRYNSIYYIFCDLTSLLLPALITFGLFKNGNEKIGDVTVVIVLSFIIINAIGSFIVDLSFPSVIRVLTGDRRATGDSTLQYYYFRFGVANYALPHAITVIIPALVMGIKRITEKRIRIFLIVALIACMMLIYLSGAATALILGIFTLIISIMTRSNGRNGIWLLVVGILIFIVLSNDSIILSILEWFDGVIGGEGYFHSKVRDFEDLIVYGQTGGDIEARSDLYNESLDAVISNPIFGVNEKIGEHSALIDHWGYLGLVGFIPYILFFIFQIKNSYWMIQQKNRLFYIEGVFAAIVMLSLKAFDGWEICLFIITISPLLIRFVENKTNIVVTI